MIDERTAACGLKSRWTRADTLAIVLVTLIGGVLRIVRLGNPSRLVFDETYYARDACWYAFGASEPCGIEGAGNFVHPPLGKWLIAGGIEALGYDPVGWRIASVVVGTMTIALVYLLARKLLSSTLGGLVASGLVVFDFLHFVQSRIAMLDVFVAFFGLAAVLFVVYDNDRLTPSFSEHAHSEDRHPNKLVRPWRVAAGIALGAAAASKWSGLLFIPLCLVLMMTREIRARRADGYANAVAPALRSQAVPMLLWLVALPALVYALSYAGRLDGSLAAAPWTQASWFRSLWERQLAMIDFHFDLKATHAYQSPPWSWLLLKRPVAYFFETTDTGAYKEVIALGNPLVWWSSILALAYTAFAWLRSKDPAGPQGIVLAGFGLTYLPWLLSTRSAVFVFYLLPTIPFMALALAYVATRMQGSRAGRSAIALFSASVIALFAYYYPLLAAVPIPYEQWRDRIWIFGSDAACEKVEDKPSIESTRAEGGTVAADAGQSEDDLPPKGWCWI